MNVSPYWTMTQLANALDIQPQTVRKYRQIGVLPAEDLYVLGRPVWRPATIVYWAAETGRIDPATGTRLPPARTGRPPKTDLCGHHYPCPRDVCRPAGHAVTLDPPGGVNISTLRVAVCECGRYRSGRGVARAVLKAWREHATAALERLTPVDNAPPVPPCPTLRCTHRGGCGQADARRAAGGHTLEIVPAPKMDAPALVAAQCSCGRYRSTSTSPPQARKAWQAHADASTTPEPPPAR